MNQSAFCAFSEMQVTPQLASYITLMFDENLNAILDQCQDDDCDSHEDLDKMLDSVLEENKMNLPTLLKTIALK